jgi:hypothetical protein
MDGTGGGAACVLVLGGRESNKKGRQGQTGEKRRNRAATAGARGAGRQTRRHGIGRVFRSLPSIEGREEEATYKQARPSWDGPKPITALHSRQSVYDDVCALRVLKKKGGKKTCTRLARLRLRKAGGVRVGTHTTE